MITLIHDCVIDVNQNNYTLMLDKHKKDKSGNPVYEILGYYSNLESAICNAKDYHIKRQLESDIFTLSEAINVIKQVTKEFEDLLKDVQK